MFARRDFLKIMATGSLAVGCQAFFPRAWGAAASSKYFAIKDIKRTTVKLPYRPAPERAMDRELPHWRWIEIFEVKLGSGKVGIGETLLHYTWGVTEDDDVKSAMGKNAVEIMWDDSIGAGLQMAIFDAVARTAEVPVHRLLGDQVHQTTPLSWWNIDTSVEDMASECRQAYKEGYLAYKTKGRPWFDLWKQVEAAVAVVPPEFKIDMDFNGTLLDARRGLPILLDLERHEHIDIYESPIPQVDVEGNRKITDATRVGVALHYGTPSPQVCVRERVCDGFVIGGGAQRTMARGLTCGQVDLPFWLQLVGSGITAAFSLHFGAVLSHARWPAVNCHQLYAANLLTQPIVVQKGRADVPDVPGLGYDLDRDVMEKYRVDKPKKRPDPPRLIMTTWPDGRRMYYGSGDAVGRVNFVLHTAIDGEIPYYERGVDTKLVPNDGSDEWQRLYLKAREKPFLVK